MKVYDTDEAAVARGARQRMLARLIQIAIVLAFSAAGIWAFYSLVLAPKTQDALQPTTSTVALVWQKHDAAPPPYRFPAAAAQLRFHLKAGPT